MDEEEENDTFAHAKKRAALQRAHQALQEKKEAAKVSAQGTQKQGTQHIQRTSEASAGGGVPVNKSVPRTHFFRSGPLLRNPQEAKEEARNRPDSKSAREGPSQTAREGQTSSRWSDISNTTRLTIEAQFRKAPNAQDLSRLAKPKNAGIMAAHVDKLFNDGLPGFHAPRKVTLTREHASSPVPAKKAPVHQTHSARGSSFGAGFHGDSYVESIKQHALAAQGDLTSFDLNRENMELIKKIMTAGNLFGKFVRCSVLAQVPGSMGLLCLRLRVEHIDRAFIGDVKVGELLFGLFRSENRTENVMKDPAQLQLEIANPTVVFCTHSRRKYLMIKIFRMVKTKLN